MENKYGLDYKMSIQSLLEKYPIMNRYWDNLPFQDATFDNKKFVSDTNHFPPYPFNEPGSVSYCLDVLEKIGKDITKEWI